MNSDQETASTDRGAAPQEGDGPERAELTTSGPATTDASDIVPYVVPMVAYVALGSLEPYLPSVSGHPSGVWYPLGYGARVVIVAALAWYFRATWRDFRPWPRLPTFALAVLIGLFVWALWVGLDGWYPSLPFLGKRVGFDMAALDPVARWFFIVIRMLGLVVLVPVIEELFWRSFLIRWLADPDFQKIPVGRVTLTAAAVTSIAFALVHPEWLPGLLTGALWAWLLWRTKSLAACLVSHAVANLALGIYVIATGDWKYW
jgi:uncharacterized protein